MRRIPVFWISSAFLLGIPLAVVLPFPIEVWKSGFWICLLFLLLEIFARKKGKIFAKTFLPVFLLVTIFMGGGWRSAAIKQSPFSFRDLAYYNDLGKTSLSGMICSDPLSYERSMRFTVCVDQLYRPDNLTVRGKVLVIQRSGEWKYGDRVKISGKLKAPGENEEFSYKDYLAQKGIHSLMEYPFVEFVQSNQGGFIKTGLFWLRQRAYHIIEATLPQPEAGLLSGILLGIETDIPDELDQAFRNTGTAHIVAISGFNMAILAGIFLKGFRKYLSIWWALLLAVVVISLYTVLVGGAPAVVRAAVMSCLAMSASLIGRNQSGIYMLTLTSAVMCLFNPLLLWDAGFQLSVTATLGLILYADRLMNWFRAGVSQVLPDTIVEKISAPVGDYFLFTLAAQLMTLPVMLYHFGKISFTTLLANPLILPVQPLIMILGGIAVIVGLVIPALGQVLFYGVYVFLFYTNQVVTWLGGYQDGWVLPGQINFLTILVIYLLIFYFTQKKKDGWLAQQKPLLMLAVMVTSIFLVWNGVIQRADGKLHVWVLADPNQGVILMKTPSGKRILINAGEYANTLSSELNQHLSAFDRSIDLTLVSGAKINELTAYPKIVERFKVKQFFWGEEIPRQTTGIDLLHILEKQKVPYEVLIPQQKIDCGDGVVIQRQSLHQNGLSFRISFQDFQLVLLEELPPVDKLDTELDGAIVLARPGLSVNFADLPWQPFVLIHHQHIDLSEPGQLSTASAGTIEIITDGKQMWVLGDR